MKTWIVAAAASLALAGAARAEVAEQWDTGFTTRNVVEVKATRERAYAALGEIGRWWNGAHSYSQNPANMTLTLKPGGCFCEALPGGGVQHGVVIMAWPAQGLLRLEAALGPLQDMGVSAELTFQIKPKGAGVEVIQTYTVGGGRPGLPKIVAAGVDQVVAEQLKRFATYVETGKPE
jgi:hypothetical protein